MANFEDITGWWEEIQEFADSDEWEAMEESQKMPIEWVPELMQLVLRHEEIREDFMTYGNWIVANHLYDKKGRPIGLRELPDDFPHSESYRASWFAIWFFNIGKKVKKILPVAGTPTAMFVARLIAEGGEDINLHELLAKLKRLGDDDDFDLNGSINEKG